MTLEASNANQGVGLRARLRRCDGSGATLSACLADAVCLRGGETRTKANDLAGTGVAFVAGAKSASPSEENQRRYYGSIVDTTTAVRRAHITLYSVAPLNLAHGDAQSAFLFEGYLKGVASPAQADSPQASVQVLAVHSGGLALYKSGDLVSQIGRCLGDANGYYEATFEAAPGEPLGQYRTIDIKVNRPGVTVRTNTAYYAGLPQSTAEPATSSPGVHQAPLRTQARLVILDVTVLDNKGVPVAGLKADDFQLLDAGRPQKVAHVEEHIGAEGRTSPQPSPAAPAGDMVVSNKPPDGTLWNVVAVDLINTPKEDRGHLQDQLEAFARLIPPGTPVALVSMADGIKVLSSFTAGQPDLLQALEKGLGPLNIGGLLQNVESLSEARSRKMSTSSTRTDLQRRRISMSNGRRNGGR